MEKPNTTRRRRKWLLQGNQNRLFGPLMRSNCCCDSHSTTRQVNCKKGSISSAARTQACILSLVLLLRDVAGFRGRRQEVEGWDNGVIVLESMRIGCPYKSGRPAFSDFSTLRPVFKKSAFSGSVWTVGQKETIQVCCRKKAFSCGRPLTPLGF